VDYDTRLTEKVFWIARIMFVYMSIRIDVDLYHRSLCLCGEFCDVKHGDYRWSLAIPSSQFDKLAIASRMHFRILGLCRNNEESI
jgi:hypothetical protein